MKRIVLTLLVAFIAAHTPWRLIALGAEAIVMTPGDLRLANGTDQYWDELALEGRVMAFGYGVGVKKNLTTPGMFSEHAVWGYTDKTHHLVMLEEKLNWNDRRSVLAHEAGHILQPDWVETEQGEVFAETVAALVCKDGLREHARYLARYKTDMVLMYLVSWRAMYHAAAVLEDR